MVDYHASRCQKCCMGTFIGALVRSKWVILAVGLCFLQPLTGSEGYRILVPVTSSFHTPSHVKLISTLSKALKEKGHHVTVLRWSGWENYPNDSFSDAVIYDGCFATREEGKKYSEKIAQQFTLFGSDFFEMINNVRELENGFSRCCRDLFADEKTLRILEDGDYDLTLVFYLSTCNGILAQYLKIPFVVFSSTVRLPGLDETMFGMPMPSSYVPHDVFSSMTDKMSFPERLGNFLHFYVDEALAWIFSDSLAQLQVDYHIRPELNQKALFSDALLWLSHVDVTLDYARPFTPNVIPIGGILVTEEQPLKSKDLIEFVEGAGTNGVVICSLGSAVKSLGDEKTAIMLKTFNGLKQRVLWKFEGNLPKGIPVGEHIRIAKWLPQNDLLAHPQIKLMIYHGGMNGIYEAIYHGVPMVLLPLFADQFFTSSRVQDKGMGIMLDVSRVTEESFQAAIDTVLHDESFKTSADRLSAIFRDLNKHQTPLERAVYWIEHVLRFGGAHLRPRSVDMGTIELYMLDVMLFLIIVIFVIAVITKRTVGCLYRCCCKKNNLDATRRSAESKKEK